MNAKTPFNTSPARSGYGGVVITPEAIGHIVIYIKNHWDDTLRIHQKDDGSLIGLPYPYVVPCRKDNFQELYYWDTYFTCLGLIESGRTDLAVFCLRNFLYLIKRVGFVPNGSRTYYLNRSHPPYLAALVQRIGTSCFDLKIMDELRIGVKAEYDFWEKNRNSPTGLAHYGNHASKEQLKQFFDEVQKRANLTGHTEEEQLNQSFHMLAEAESGWDFTPRFAHRCGDSCAVDLNSNLYLYEKLLSELSSGEEKKTWEKRATIRQQRITSYCWNQEAGAFFDYDFVNKCHNDLLAASTFHPLWAGIATPEQAALVTELALPKLELEYGVVPCEPGVRDSVCQWDHPNIWPCLQFIVYRGLARYGYIKEARRIAAKYINVVCRGFQETGDLWEKYNAEDGSTKTKAEAASYVTPAMMGWTAGVFMDAVAFLKLPHSDSEQCFPHQFPRH